MTHRLLHLLLRTALLVALVAATALFVDYSSPSPAFCGVSSGCEAVKYSAFSHIGGVGLPSIGLGVFVGMYAMALWARERRHHQIFAVQMTLVSFGAVALIGIMLFVLDSLCRWCLAADVSAIIAGVAAIALASRVRPGERDPEPTPLRMLWAGLGVAAVAAPMLWRHAPVEAEVPAGVAALYQPSKVNVVMFTDFECPFCRALHPAFVDLKKKHGDRIHMARVMVPLRGHPGAEPAARGYLCVPPDAREAMADALYNAEALESKGVALMAKQLGHDIGACMQSDETSAKVEADKAMFQNAGLSGLPSTYVERELVRGADEPQLIEAVDRGLGGGNRGADVRWLFAFLALLWIGVMGVSVKAARGAQVE
jgi:uncharacterized membrane protein/protein-disulfide isomerase